MNRPTIVALFFLTVLVLSASAVSAEQDQDYKYSVASAWPEPGWESQIKGDPKKISIFDLSLQQLLDLLCDEEGTHYYGDPHGDRCYAGL